MRLIFSLSKAALFSLLLLFLLVPQANANQPVESFLWKASAAASAVLIATTNPIQADRISMELGGGEHVNVVRVGAEWDWNDDLMTVFGWDLSTYWQLEFSRWQSTRDASQDGANVTAGLIPMFRFTGNKGYFQPYLDVGVGISFFTVSQLEDHEFGSNFQFTDLFVLGARFGKRHQWALSYKFQHYSNGAVRVPNQGINFNFLTLSYKY